MNTAHVAVFIVGCLSISPGRCVALEATYLSLQGMYDAANNDFRLSTPVVVPRLRPRAPSSSGGTCRAELLDAKGKVLSTQSFEPKVLKFQFSHSGTAEMESATDSADVDSWVDFELDLPWNEATRELRIHCAGRLVHRQARSPHAPDVDFEGLDEGAVLTGTQEIRWRVEDRDDDQVFSFLSISIDEDRKWLPLSVRFESTRHSLDSTHLVSGPALLTLTVTDGMNTRRIARRLTITNPLRVQGATPMPDKRDASLVAPIQAHFVSALDPSSLSDRTFELFHGNEKIAAQVRIDFPMQASLRPQAPLRPRTRYRARLQPTLRDIHGNHLESPYEWEFTTEPDSVPPQVEYTTPGPNHEHSVTQRVLQAVFSESVQWADASEAFVVLDDRGDRVAGTVTAGTRRQPNDSLIFVPAAPLVPGMDYTMRLSGKIADAAGNRMQEHDEETFTAAERPVATDYEIRAHIVPDTIDSDGNGSIEKLTVAVDVIVARPGRYTLRGELTDRTTRIDQSQVTGDLSLGLNTLQLVFDGKAIRASGKDGPYVTEALVLYPADDPDSRFEYDKSSPYIYDFRATDFEAETSR